MQRGSPESKPLGPGRPRVRRGAAGRRARRRRTRPRWARAGGWRTRLYSNSLLRDGRDLPAAPGSAQSIAGRVAYNAERFDHQQDADELAGSTSARPDFWNRTLQNWQSEFLAVGSMAVLAIYLRQRGSPESKPVGTPHSATGAEG